jgi:predicted metal-dependent phosphotriesterase family hydrolase
MLSHDWSVIFDNDNTPAWRKERLPDNPHHYLFIDRVIRPRLEDMGVSGEIVHQIMVENTRRFFKGA